MIENTFIKNKILIKRISDWCVINSDQGNIKFTNRDIIDDKSISFSTSFIETLDTNNIRYIIYIKENVVRGKLNIEYSKIKDSSKIDKILKELDIKNDSLISLNEVIIDDSSDNQFLNINLDNFLKNILLFENKLRDIINFKEDNYYIEGALKSISSNKYERNKEARKACLDHYGTKCQICGIDLGKVYGVEFSGKIEVHHIVPISKIKKTYVVDPIKDLIPVCPNCHMILHSKNEGVYTPEEIKKILKK